MTWPYVCTCACVTVWTLVIICDFQPCTSTTVIVTVCGMCWLKPVCSTRVLL